MEMHFSSIKTEMTSVISLNEGIKNVNEIFERNTLINLNATKK